MRILTKTPTDRLIEKAIRKTEQKAYEKEVKMILKMINDNLSNESISDYSDFSLEEIAKIREENSIQ